SQGTQGVQGSMGGPTNQPGISGLAIDAQDRIYVFNRGVKPVMVFDTAGNLILSGADQEINGKTINPSWQHSGGVDWEGNVYVIERDAHRIVKLSPKLDKFLLQLGVTNEKGTDATHLNLPSGIAILHSGNMVVTDGYGNNRAFANDGWNPWDINISRKGTDGFAFVADHALERVHKIQTKDGKILATWGSQGLGPNQFDWVHGIVVDSHGAVYAADTYGQR